MKDSSSLWAGPKIKAGVSFSSSSSYRLIRRLGAGGMGEVWQAERRSAAGHTQMVALKFLSDVHAGGSLVEEALRISKLAHDNIVPFLDSGRDLSGRYFVAMALVNGVDLDGLRALVGLQTEACYEQKPKIRIPGLLVGFIIFMVLRALKYAHAIEFAPGEIGLIHRDISPGNILIDVERGFVKLTDFGVAIQAQGGGSNLNPVAGKVPYMAPEVLRGETVDPRVDLYSLGVVAYEMLTGFNPNVHPSRLRSVIASITDAMMAFEQPLRPCHEVVAGIDPDISAIVAKLIATDPADRYASADEVNVDLVPYLYELGVGPSTASVAAFIHMVQHLDQEPTEEAQRALIFLRGSDGSLLAKPSWSLRPEAVAEIKAGRNPARVW